MCIPREPLTRTASPGARSSFRYAASFAASRKWVMCSGDFRCSAAARLSSTVSAPIVKMPSTFALPQKTPASRCRSSLESPELEHVAEHEPALPRAGISMNASTAALSEAGFEL